MQENAIQSGQSVIVVDDLIATGSGTNLWSLISSLNKISRRFRTRRWRAGRQARRKDFGIPVHHRTDVPQS